MGSGAAGGARFVGASGRRRDAEGIWAGVQLYLTFGGSNTCKAWNMMAFAASAVREL